MSPEELKRLHALAWGDRRLTQQEAISLVTEVERLLASRDAMYDLWKAADASWRAALATIEKHLMAS